MIRTVLMAVLTAAVALSAHADDDTHFVYREVLQAKNIKEDLDPDVHMFWGSEKPPELAEYSRADSYVRIGLSIMIWGGSRKHCLEAFDNILKAMVGDAKARGYDTVFDIHAVDDEDRPIGDPDGFDCAPGYNVTTLRFRGRFGLTPAAFRRVDDEDRQAAALPVRPATPKRVRIPLEPILASSDARTLLGPDLEAYVGLPAPAYTERFGPTDYSATVSLGDLDRNEACRQAVMKTLAQIVADAKERKYDSIIKLRSYVDDDYAPYTSSVECEIGWRGVSATLQSSLAMRKRDAAPSASDSAAAPGQTSSR